MRLAGIAKMGYYPTPPKVAEQILSILDIRPGCCVLDPCCGEGAVLKQFKQSFKDTITYGVELDALRFEVASTVTDRALNCDSVNELKSERMSFDVLWENPPYDWDVVEDDTQRVEKTFYKAHKGLVSPNGLILFLIPFCVLKSCVNLLSRLRELRVFAFPKGEYEVFKQIVVMGKQYLHTDEDENYKSNHQLLQSIVKSVPAETAYEHLTTTEQAALKGEKLYLVERSGNPVIFRSKRIDPEEVYELVKASKLSQLLGELQTIDEIKTIIPIAPLTEGHLAMLLAAGMMDGEFVGSDGERYVVKGSVKAGTTETETMDAGGETSKILQRTNYNIVVKSINLTRGTMEIISA
jgi:SAM-dependent methyltransferase